MKVRNIILTIFVLIVVSSIVFSLTNLSPVQVTDDISLTLGKECKTIYWTVTEKVYGDCIDPKNNSVHTCLTGEKEVQKSKETCVDKQLEIEVDNVLASKKYKLEYKDWGTCFYSAENQTLVVICDSQFDGNDDGICQRGESCVKFIVEKDSVKTLYRNSRDDFVENDQTFKQRKLSLEVI